MSDNPELVDFAIGPVNSVHNLPVPFYFYFYRLLPLGLKIWGLLLRLNLPDGQVKFFLKNLNYRRTARINLAHQKVFGAS